MFETKNSRLANYSYQYTPSKTEFEAKKFAKRKPFSRFEASEETFDEKKNVETTTKNSVKYFTCFDGCT